MTTHSQQPSVESLNVSQMMTISQANILGIRVDAIDMDSAVAGIQSALNLHCKGYICLCGVHGVMQAQEDAEFYTALANALMVCPDGMPTVWAGHFQGFKQMKRVFGPDLMIEIISRPEFVDCTHFLCGGDYGVAENLRACLTARFPHVQIVGIYTPPFRAMDDKDECKVREMVANCHPDIMWIGLSTPKQELFMARYLPLLDTTLMIGVGAAFLFHTGKIRDSPSWVKRAGFQWFHRLLQEPSRLWRRYLFSNPKFIAKLALQLVGFKQYPLKSEYLPGKP
jgi:N-acetylglucosaminyldiphosphoundecaprenol N-acetyl-beta-D-mannosaminyltransferase